jgi:hypothetical protein
MKSNFSRLETMYHQSLDEVNKVKSEYEAKIIIANDNFRVVKAENEVLKERVDVLFKLGRSYLNSSKPKETDKTEDIEVVEDTEDDSEEDDTENLSDWTKNKLRGFKRVDPTKPPTVQKTKKTNKTQADVHPPPKSPTPPKSSASIPEASSGNERDSANTEVYRGRYCHYFVNQGKCHFEERTGRKCQYEHKQAPMCNFGTSCTRLKCMYSHPKLPRNQNQNNQSFLGQNMMNPWQMMNPWMNQQPSPWSMPNPWNQKMSGNSSNTNQ